MKYFARKLLNLFITALFCCGALWLLGFLIGWPYLSEEPVEYSTEQLEQAKNARDVRFDPDSEKLPSLHRDLLVNPRGQAPVLEELVALDKLPPLKQRLPDKPIVMEGPDGIGKYGGTWFRIATSMADMGTIGWRFSYASLLRWSPLGFPIEPHVAESVTPLNGNREFEVKLRKGARWSDDHPLTANDIMYWWENEILDPAVSSMDGRVPNWLTIHGEPCEVVKVDELTVKFVFPHPYGLFLQMLATPYGKEPVGSPKHYRSKYHPKLGDKKFIEEEMKNFGMATPRALYDRLMRYWPNNSEHPRLWPWIPRRYQANPPYLFVRNPYYFAVDTEGNQLPYFDQIQFDIQQQQFLTVSALSGGMTMQTRHIRYSNYTELLSRQQSSGMRILHWYPATRAVWVINPNNTRRVDPDQPDTRWKRQLLSDKRFRQALSLAINRDDIIQAEYNNQVRPAQVAPGPESPFHNEGLTNAFIEFNPDRANQLLDELNLTGRSLDGMRQFPDSTPMIFYLDYSPFTGMGPAQFVIEDWARVGVRAVVRERARALFYIEKQSKNFDFNIWSSEADYFPLISPRYFVPRHSEAFWAVGWAEWFKRGGYFGHPNAEIGSAERPPDGHPIWSSYDAYERAIGASTPLEQKRLFNQALDIAAENVWSIGIAEAPPQLVVVKEGVKNVPLNALYSASQATPGNAGMELYYYEDPTHQPSATLESFELVKMPREGQATPSGEPNGYTGILIRFLIVGIISLLVVLLVLRHPFVGQRLLIMVPTLLIISVVIFIVIQLPQGDFLTTKAIQLQESGYEHDLELLEGLKKRFHLHEPPWKRYLWWMGLNWFITFDNADKGLIQGQLGISMEQERSVNALVGDRILLTVLIAMGTIFFTWSVAIPIGIYSAVRQYSVGDYVLTLIGFIGMCVPPFLLALVLMTMAEVTGLFSPEYAQANWTWARVIDLLKHIWVPVVVLGVTGTAAMIRIMRANLLDELKKPYVTTARAKGVHPLKVLLKYPVRLALNPFVSGIGSLFPQLVAGGAIVAMVLSLPTVGPMLLQSLFNEDMYLAGSMLMILSLLGVFGILVSDLLLLWLDPRIRFEGRA